MACVAERKGKCKGKGVYASLFGVGAPEVLVIGVVALLVFGPKGLAEVSFHFLFRFFWLSFMLFVLGNIVQKCVHSYLISFLLL